MTDKKLPEGTTELYKHLGVHEDDAHADSTIHENDAHLPVDHTTDGDADAHAIDKDLADLNASTFNLGKAAKNILPYFLVFIVAVGLFLYFFTGTSIKAMFASLATPKPTAVTQATVPSGELAAYNSWIKSYFYDVTDPSVLDPNTDISGDGLTNYQKFLLGLNPLKTDTMGIGMSDTQALISGIDPLTGVQLSSSRQQIIASSIDLEAVSNKLSLAVADSTPQVAGASTTAGSTTNVPSAQEGRSEVIIDTSIPGQINIPALKITVPLIWTQNPNNFETDLKSGVVHYPGTAMPGEIGTSYISGHSSNYAWIKSQYNNIFATLGNLKQYDSFTITVKDNQGKTVIFHYVVDNSNIYKANDQAQFASIGKSTVALSTCWPVGTSDKRLVVFGELTQVER